MGFDRVPLINLLLSRISCDAVPLLNLSDQLIVLSAGSAGTRRRVRLRQQFNNIETFIGPRRTVWRLLRSRLVGP